MIKSKKANAPKPSFPFERHKASVDTSHEETRITQSQSIGLSRTQHTPTLIPLQRHGRLATRRAQSCGSAVQAAQLKNEHYQIVRLLLDRHADVNAPGTKLQLLVKALNEQLMLIDTRRYPLESTAACSKQFQLKAMIRLYAAAARRRRCQ